MQPVWLKFPVLCLWPHDVRAPNMMYRDQARYSVHRSKVDGMKPDSPLKLEPLSTRDFVHRPNRYELKMNEEFKKDFVLKCISINNSTNLQAIALVSRLCRAPRGHK